MLPASYQEGAPTSSPTVRLVVLRILLLPLRTSLPLRFAGRTLGSNLSRPRIDFPGENRLEAPDDRAAAGRSGHGVAHRGSHNLPNRCLNDPSLRSLCLHQPESAARIGFGRRSRRSHAVRRSPAANVRLLAGGADLLVFGASSPACDPAGPRPIPAWHRCRRSETLGDTLAVLGRAGQLLQHEAHGAETRLLALGGTVRCRRAPVWHAATASLARSCARACEPSVPVQDACIALEQPI